MRLTDIRCIARTRVPSIRNDDETGPSIVHQYHNPLHNYGPIGTCNYKLGHVYSLINFLLLTAFENLHLNDYCHFNFFLIDAFSLHY